MPPGQYTLSAGVTHQGVRSDVAYASVHIVDSDVRVDLEIGHAAAVYGKVEAPQAFPLQDIQIAVQTYGPGFYLLHGAKLRF